MKVDTKGKCNRGRAARVLRHVAATSVVVTILFALLLGTTMGAEQATTQNTTAVEPTVIIPEDEFGRGSPRSTVKGYLEASREGDYQKAANYLDLRRIQGDGSALARQLRTVLSRTMWVDVEALSPEHEGKKNDGQPANRDRLGTIDTQAGKVDILLQLVPREDGVTIWKFAGATVALVPELYKEFGYGVLERFLPKIFFDIQFLDIALWQWIGILVLVLFAAIGSWILTVVAVRALETLVSRTKTTIDDKMRAGAAGPVRLALAALVFRVGLVPLGLGVEAMRILSALLSGLFVVAVAWLLLRVTDVLSGWVKEELIERGQVGATALVPPGRKFVKTLVVLFALVAVLSNFGFNVAALLAGLGVGGIAVALAAQKTIENLFGGLILYADRPVRVGDFCRFGDKMGTVEEIGIRSTRVRTLDHTVITVPNATFSNMELDNITARERIRLLAIITVRYETTPDPCATRRHRTSCATSWLRFASCSMPTSEFYPIHPESVSSTLGLFRWTSKCWPMQTLRTGPSSSGSGKTSSCGSWTSSRPAAAASPFRRRPCIWGRTMASMPREFGKFPRRCSAGGRARRSTCRTSPPTRSQSSKAHCPILPRARRSIGGQVPKDPIQPAYFMIHLLRPRIWASFQPSSGLTPCDVLLGVRDLGVARWHSHLRGLATEIQDWTVAAGLLRVHLDFTAPEAQRWIKEKSQLEDVADRLMVRMGGVIDELEDKSAELEEAVLTAESHKLRPMLDSIRRDAINLRRYMAPQREAIARLQIRTFH